ncbi:hypothetical protein GCM10009795_096720 [Nocardioides hankookensis]|uniref:ParB/RepB/Spo0J family partition protein n=1 Tax=Nocardioides hankookensis TaxID=443157 RepID=A0ABW1LN40_9ACTN
MKPAPDATLATVLGEAGDGGSGRVLVDVVVASVAPHPENPRKELGDLRGLAASIADLGVLQPILVVSRDAFVAANPSYADEVAHAEYVLKAGERRLAASKLAGRWSIPAIVDPAQSERDTLRTFLHENMHRLELDPIEEARLYEVLRDDGETQQEIAVACRVSQSHVSKRLALLRLSPDVQSAVREDRIQITDAIALASLQDETRDQVWGAWSEDADAQQTLGAAIRANELAHHDPSTGAAHSMTGAGDEATASALTPEGSVDQDPQPAADVPAGSETKARASAPGGGIPVEEQRRAARKRAEAIAKMLLTPPSAGGEGMRDVAAELLVRPDPKVLREAHRHLSDAIPAGKHRGQASADPTEWCALIASRTDRLADQNWLAWALCVIATQLRSQRLPWDRAGVAQLEVLRIRAGYEPTAWESRQRAVD